MFLSLLITNMSFASIITFNCSSNNQNAEYEINERIFDTQGYYLTVKKRKDFEVEYLLFKFSNSLGFKKFIYITSYQARLKPIKQEVLKHYSVRDLSLMPIVYWIHEDPLDINSNFHIEEKIDGQLANTCRKKIDKNYTEKEYVDFKMKTKKISPFELIEDYANDTKYKTIDLSKRIYEKELDFNEEIRKKNIDHAFIFEDKNGQTISRNSNDSSWNKFWGVIGYIISEHGEELLAMAIDAKYGNTSRVQTPKMYCVSQRVGKSRTVHTHCRQR